MASFEDWKAYLLGYLGARGWDPLPTIDPGPGDDDDAIDSSPDRLVLLSPSSGVGFTTEMVFDQPGMQARVAGKQGDYNDAEALAKDVDRALVTITSQQMGSRRVLSVPRAGGGPALLLRDSAGRYHFTCNYLPEVEAGLDE